MHERCAGGKPDLIPILREDILAAIGKHVTVDPDKVRLKIERGEMVSLLEIDIEIPTSMKHGQDRFATGVQFPLSWG
jgi:cell division topological specificity factor